MTNITREQIEDCIKTNSSTEDEHRQICTLALRALDTTSAKPSQSIVEAVAAAWASIDGHADDFMSGKDASDISAFGGRYAGYMEDAEELLKRSGIVELIEAKAYERAACAAEGPLLEINDNTGEARYRGTAKGNWTVPQPIAGFRGSDYGTGRYDVATAIRTLSPTPTRFVELPEGHVVVPVEPTKDMIKAGEGAGNYWSQGADNIYRAMIGEVK